MNVLFINYWGIADGLTQATTLPSLRLLNDHGSIKKVIFVTIEREGLDVDEFTDLDKVIHVPFFSNSKFPLLNKVSDFTVFPRKLISLCKTHLIHKIIARGALAGGLAWLTSKKTKTPFVVESYEPHAEYMISNKTWNRFGLKYRIQKYFEAKQNLHAAGLIVVSSHYQSRLIQSGITSTKIALAPCPVNSSKFYYNEDIRLDTRKELGCDSDVIIGIYVGKFGDLYYKEEVIPIFDQCFKIFTNFQLVILTPQNDSFTDRLKNIYKNRVAIKQVAHQCVNNYLCASDFGFATYSQAKIKLNLSPVKVGEYWACGLPVLITEDIGDDSQIISSTGLGATFSIFKPNSIHQGLIKMQDLLMDKSIKKKVQQLTQKYRSIKYTKMAYEKLIFKNLS